MGKLMHLWHEACLGETESQLYISFLCLFLCSLGMLEFFGSVRTQLAKVSQEFREWQREVEQSRLEGGMGDEGEEYLECGSRVIRTVMLCVQRVMNKHYSDHSAFTASTDSSGT